MHSVVQVSLGRVVAIFAMALLDLPKSIARYSKQALPGKKKILTPSSNFAGENEHAFSLFRELVLHHCRLTHSALALADIFLDPF